MLLHVVDVSHPDASKQAAAVFDVLHDINVDPDIPMVTAWNKLDACHDAEAVTAAGARRPETVVLSAQSGAGVDALLAAIEAAMEERMTPFEALIPYGAGAAVSELRERGVVRAEEYTEEGVRVRASADAPLLGRLEPFVLQRVPQERIFTWRHDQEDLSRAAATASLPGAGAAVLAEP